MLASLPGERALTAQSGLDFFLEFGRGEPRRQGDES
jgi:hypothetical protein